MKYLLPLLLALALQPTCQSSSSSGGDDDTDTGTGSDSDTDTDTDTDSDTDTDTDTGLSIDDCTEIAVDPCPSSSSLSDPGYLGELEPLLSAGDFGEDVRFVDVQQQTGNSTNDGMRAAVLAASGEGDSATAFIFVGGGLDFWETQPPLWLTGYSSPVEPIALTHQKDSPLGYGFIALLCGSDECFLAGLPSELPTDEDFAPLPDGTVPDLANPIDLISWAAGDSLGEYGVTVVGDGMVTWNGTGWIANPTASDQYAAVAETETPWFTTTRVAVGGEGLVEWDEETEWITGQYGDSSLFDVAAFGPSFVAVGQSGIIVDFEAIGDGTPAPTGLVCSPSEDDLVVAGGSNLHAKTVTVNGQVLVQYGENQDAPFCILAEAPGPVLSGVFFDCGWAQSFMFVTEQAVYGYWYCFDGGD